MPEQLRDTILKAALKLMVNQIDTERRDQLVQVVHLEECGRELKCLDIWEM